jgi:hypothetical protein
LYLFGSGFDPQELNSYRYPEALEKMKWRRQNEAPLSGCGHFRFDDYQKGF